MWWRGLTPLGKWIGVIALIFFLFGLVYLGLHFSGKAEDKDNANLVNSGVVQERAATQSEALNNVKAARDAVERPTDAERNSVCSKYDRNCPIGQ